MTEEEKKIIRNSAYFKAAEDALVNWNGMTREDAQKFLDDNVENKAAIEEQVGAETSIRAAAESFGKQLETSHVIGGQSIHGAIDASLGNTSDLKPVETLKNNVEKLKRTNGLDDSQKLGLAMSGLLDIMDLGNGKFDEQTVLNAIEAVHNAWVKNPDNQKLFFTKKKDKGQEYQFLPTELIGWKEVESDLIFVEPVAKQFGIEVDREKIKQEYYDRVVEFFQKNPEIKNYKGLSEYIKNNKLEHVERAGIWKDHSTYYKEIWNEDIKNAFENEEFLNDVIAKELQEKGFGSDKELVELLKEKGVFEKELEEKDKDIDDNNNKGSSVKADEAKIEENEPIIENNNKTPEVKEADNKEKNNVEEIKIENKAEEKPKKILASNNSKAKEMLEAIAINKQTENLRKNKLSMLDRAKEVRSKAYLTLERVTNKAKEVLVNNKLIKGAIAGFKNAVRITKKSLKYAGIITIAGGALYIGTTYAPTHGVDQPEVGEGPGITEKAEDMQIETSQDIEIKKDGDGYKIVHNGMNDPGGKYVKTDKNGNKYKVDAIEAGQEHNQKEIADYTGEEEVNITDTSNASATKESQERQNQDEQSGKKTTVHEKNETTTNYEKGMEKDNKGAQQQANGQTRNENDTSKDVKVEEQKQENLTSQEKQGNNVSTNTSSTQSKNEIDDFSDDLDDIIKAYENQQKEK